jgi:signal transduction histidine kinase
VEKLSACFKKLPGDIIAPFIAFIPIGLIKYALYRWAHADVIYVFVSVPIFVVVYYRGILSGVIGIAFIIVQEYMSYELPIGVAFFSRRFISLTLLTVVQTGIIIVFARRWRRGHLQAIADRDRLTEAAKYRDLLMGTLGHDLRTPLTAITTSVQILRRVVEARQDVLRRMESGCRRMAGMIDQVMDMTAMHLGAGLQLNLSRVDLVELARRTIEEVAVVYPGIDIQLYYVEAPIIGLWDETRLCRTLMNLLTNACKYGNCDHVIDVSLLSNDGNVTFSVKNQGDPIPTDLLPLLFDPFQRGDIAVSKAMGLGLGLYITAEMVDKHGGHIDVQSTRENGTVFTVTLPRGIQESSAKRIGAL